MVTLQQKAENAQKVLREAIKSMPMRADANAARPRQPLSRPKLVQSHKEESFGHSSGNTALASSQ